MSISNEELLIRALVDEIYRIEEKINLINESINNDNINDTTLKRIENLKIIRNNLLQQKISLNNSFLLDSKNHSKIMQQKLNRIKNIENNLESKKNELINFDVLSFQCIPLKKYILSNESKDFLTEVQINDIIFDGQFPSSNFELNKLKREIEINRASECVIVNNINQIKSKIQQIKENIKMMKEEKNTVKVELINLISCKETLEQIIKLNINGLNIHNKLSNNKKNEEGENEVNNKWTAPTELHFHELCIIDIKKSAINLCNDLFDLFNLNAYIDKNITLNHNKNKSNYDMSNYAINKSKYNIEIPDNNNYSSIYFNSFIFNKNELYFLIQNEIDNYISGKINAYKTISEFLENLSILITSKFQYIDIIISSDYLTIYLSYFFKSLYYDSIINANLKFINKDYKRTKKEYKNLIPFLQGELSKLETKKNEYRSKTKIVERQIKLIKKQNFNKKMNEPMKLSLEEEKYLQICSKANGLIKLKNNLEEEIIGYKNKYNELKYENDSKIKKINLEINKIKKQLVKINQGIKNKKIKASQNIEFYQKLINEKYNIIKRQLIIYKNKYGSNLDIYNRLINSINDTIKKTYDKSPLIIINNNNNINNSHIFNNDIGKIVQNINPKFLNKNIKKYFIPKKKNDLPVTSNNLINNEETIKLNNTNCKKSLNLECDNSILYDFNLNHNLKRNNTSVNYNKPNIGKNKNKYYTSIKMEKGRKLNSKKKLNKVLSNLKNNLSYTIDSNVNNIKKKKIVKKKNNSLIYNIKCGREKTSPNYIYDKINGVLKDNYQDKFNLLTIDNDNNNKASCVTENYNKNFSKYHCKSNSIIINKSQLINFATISNNINHNKFRNKNKSTIHLTSSNNKNT